MLGPLPFRLFVNPRAGTPGLVLLPTGGFRRARAEIVSWPDYAPTALCDLPALAAEAGIATLRVKDESARFGFGHEALGAGYAVAAQLGVILARTGVAAAGNGLDLASGRYGHATCGVTVGTAGGRFGAAVAWAARRFGCRAAEVPDIALHPDDAGPTAGIAVSDVGDPAVSVDIMQAYRLIADEAADQWRGPPPTHVFVQGGAGCLAAAVAVQMRARIAAVPQLIVVEPDHAACLMSCAEAGERVMLPEARHTVMTDIARPAPDLLAWRELERAASAFMAVPDEAVVPCQRRLAAEGIAAGPCGVAGVAGLLLAAADPAARQALGLGPDCRVLAICTEAPAD